VVRNVGATSRGDLETFAAAGTGGPESGGQCIFVFSGQGQADC
jgi:hypothetical protein